MADQYFIKRGEKINGPFGVEELQALKKAKKVKVGDEISQSAEGPWESLDSYEKAKQATRLAGVEKYLKWESLDPYEKAKQSSEQPNPSPAEPSPKTVACEDCGGVVSRRAQSCPHCGAPIGQSEDQVPSAVAEDTDDEQFGADYEVDYVDPHPLPPRRKQSKSTNVKRSSKDKEQSSGKLPLIGVNMEFISDIFDMSFTKFVTPRIISLLFVLGIIALVIGMFVVLVPAFASGDIITAIVTLLISPIVFSLYLLLLRLYLELMMVAFRIEENTGRLVSLTRKIQRRTTQD